MYADELTLSSLGEKRIITEIIRKLPIINDSELLLNDDAQIIPIKSNKPLSISTDRTPSDLKALRLGLMSLFDYGRYCVISNLSDIAAMGALPIGFLLNIAASPNMLIKDFREVMEGISDALNEYGIPLLGGDTKQSDDLNLVGVALGQSYNDHILTRSGAKPGDYLIISKGDLGLTPTAFLYFNNREEFKGKISVSEENDLINSLTKITARFDESKLLSDSYLCTSCMDNTDGIYSSLIELASASGVGLDIDLSKVSTHRALLVMSDYINSPPITLMLSAGADFKLIGTVSEVSKDISSFFQVIGRVTDRINKINVDGLSRDEIESISRWNHFRK